METFRNFELEDFVYVFEDANFKRDDDMGLYEFSYKSDDTQVTFMWEEAGRYIHLTVVSPKLNVDFKSNDVGRILLLNKEKGEISIEMDYDLEYGDYTIYFQLKPVVKLDFQFI